MENEWLEPHENLRAVDRDNLILKFKQALEGRVSAAYLFGSFVRSDFRPDSDIDLFIVHQTDTEFPLRPIEFEDLKLFFPRMDIFVYTPEEFAAGLCEPSFISDQAASWLQIV